MQQPSGNRNNTNRLSLSLNVPSSVSAGSSPPHFQQQAMPPAPVQQQQQSPQQQYQPPQPSWWNNGLGFGVGGSSGGSGRRNSSLFSLADVEDSLYRNSNNQQQYYYMPNQDLSSTSPRQGAESALPTIQIEQGSISPNGYAYGAYHSGSSPTQSSTPFHRARANSSITAARNKLRIMAMLDDVRKKRELRDRRKSDIMMYLDDLLAPDDPTMANAKNSKIYRRRFKIYQFLNHPSTSTPWSITYHVMVFVIVFVCLILTICATIQQAPLQEKAIRSVYMLEKVVVVWFNIEFGFGLWSCSCKKRYRGYMGKVRYLTVPSRLIDLVILSFTTIVLVFNPSKTGHEVFVVSAFRGFHRFFQVAQVLTLNRPLKPWKVLASVIYDQREQLFIIYYTEFIVLCVLAYVAFLVERDLNENFNSIADAMWWAIVTLSTVGYGDRVPVTWIGKIISTLFTILGVAIFALPAGIIGTGLALKIEEVERNQIRNRKKVAAAILIQRAYRAWKAHTTYELVSKFFRERPMPIYKQHDYLSMAQKFIAFVQFHIGLNKFRELLRPLDLKTVMQSYSDGQTEVLLRTKLVLQSIEELARRIEITDNRVANMSMRMETKQNMFERRVDHIRQLLESCHRQLLANHLLVELLRTNNPGSRQNYTTMTTGRRYPSRQQLAPLNRSNLSMAGRPKTAAPTTTGGTSVPAKQTPPPPAPPPPAAATTSRSGLSPIPSPPPAAHSTTTQLEPVTEDPPSATINSSSSSLSSTSKSMQDTGRKSSPSKPPVKLNQQQPKRFDSNSVEDNLDQVIIEDITEDDEIVPVSRISGVRPVTASAVASTPTQQPSTAAVSPAQIRSVLPVFGPQPQPPHHHPHQPYRPRRMSL